MLGPLTGQRTIPPEIRARAELERRRRRKRRRFHLPGPVEFAARTYIETPQDVKRPLSHFELWGAQADVIHTMATERLVVILKARQLGISWIACLYSLHLALSMPQQTILIFSQGQLEANELIRRIGFMYDSHEDASNFPRVTRRNTMNIEFDNGSRIRSLPATKKGGRSFTASLVILDEFAFIQHNKALYAAVKPTIDNGGKMFIISSADGNGSHYHQFWQAAVSGVNGFKPVFLPWHIHPGRPAGWRDKREAESSSPEDVLREYPENDIEAFTHASGLVYGKVWSDGPPDGNVTEKADFEPGAGPVFWAVDDGYAGKKDKATGQYTAESHPRVFLLVQQRADGRLCVFDESYAVQKLSEDHIGEVMMMGGGKYPFPEYAGVDKSAAELKGRLQTNDVFTRNGPPRVDESIKHLRGWLAADKNGWRRIWVHPRCKHLRFEFANYRIDERTQEPVKAHDHGPDALRYFCWTKRLELADDQD